MAVEDGVLVDGRGQSAGSEHRGLPVRSFVRSDAIVSRAVAPASNAETRNQITSNSGSGPQLEAFVARTSSQLHAVLALSDRGENHSVAGLCASTLEHSRAWSTLVYSGRGMEAEILVRAALELSVFAQWCQAHSPQPAEQARARPRFHNSFGTLTSWEQLTAVGHDGLELFPRTAERFNQALRSRYDALTDPDQPEARDQAADDPRRPPDDVAVAHDQWPVAAFTVATATALALTALSRQLGDAPAVDLYAREAAELTIMTSLEPPSDR